LVLKDESINQHQSRVKLYAGLLSYLVRPSISEVAIVASSQHDIGKIGTVHDVLNKPGKLTPEEWLLMKQHPVLGAEIIEKANGGIGLNSDLLLVVLAVRHHHERWDGKGYPDGLRGEEIPLASRIIAVADAFDAMTSERPYRKAMSEDAALREILRCAGTQFDPVLAEMFLKIICNNVVPSCAAGC